MSDTSMPAVDYAILKYLDGAGSGVWKKRIYEDLDQNRDEYPFFSGSSEQTIGRHVDQMREDGLITASLVSAEDLDRQFIIGFFISDRGEDALDDARTEILKKQIVLSADAATDGLADVDIEKSALVSLIADEFGVTDEEKRATLTEKMDTESLIALLAMYYFRRNMRRLTDDLEQDQMELLADLIADAPGLREEFEDAAAISRLHDAFRPDRAQTIEESAQ